MSDERRCPSAAVSVAASAARAARDAFPHAFPVSRTLLAVWRRMFAPPVHTRGPWSASLSPARPIHPSRVTDGCASVSAQPADRDPSSRGLTSAAARLRTEVGPRKERTTTSGLRLQRKISASLLSVSVLLFSRLRDTSYQLLRLFSSSVPSSLLLSTLLHSSFA